MFSRACGRFSGRPQRPGGRRRQGPATHTPSSPGRPAWELRGDPRPGRRPVRFGDRPGEIPGADSMFSRPCGRISGRSQRPRRVTELNLSDPAPLRGDPRPGRRPARFGDRAGEIPGADSMFSRACGRFSGRSGDRNSRGVRLRREPPPPCFAWSPSPALTREGGKGGDASPPPWSECGMGEGDRPKGGGGGAPRPLLG